MNKVTKRAFIAVAAMLMLAAVPQESYGQSWLKKISQGIDKGFDAVNKGLDNVNKALGGSSKTTNANAGAQQNNTPAQTQTPAAASQQNTQSQAEVQGPPEVQGPTHGMLNNLQFEVPQYIIHPKSETANIRKQPNKSAAITKKQNRYGSYIVTQMIAAKEYNAQWYQVDEGYAAKSAFAEAKISPLTKEMFLPNFYGYMEDMDCHLEWFVADKVGAHDLALMLVGDRCDCASDGLYLGKRIGDVIVFRYRIPYFSYNYQEDVDPNLFNLVKEVDNEGDVMQTLVVGKNFMIKGVYDEGFRDYLYRLNLYKFNDKVIEKFFGEVISKGPNVEFYITSESFPDDCKNVFNF